MKKKPMMGVITITERGCGEDFCGSCTCFDSKGKRWYLKGYHTSTACDAAADIWLKFLEPEEDWEDNGYPYPFNWWDRFYWWTDDMRRKLWNMWDRK